MMIPREISLDTYLLMQATIYAALKSEKPRINYNEEYWALRHTNNLLRMNGVEVVGGKTEPQEPSYL